jgi:hypothetical protein
MLHVIWRGWLFRVNNLLRGDGRYVVSSAIFHAELRARAAVEDCAYDALDILA